MSLSPTAPVSSSLSSRIAQVRFCFFSSGGGPRNIKYVSTAFLCSISTPGGGYCRIDDIACCAVSRYISWAGSDTWGTTTRLMTEPQFEVFRSLCKGFQQGTSQYNRKLQSRANRGEDTVEAESHLLVECRVRPPHYHPRAGTMYRVSHEWRR